MKKFQTKEDMIFNYADYLQTALTKEGETLAEIDFCLASAEDSVIYVPARMVPLVASFLPEKIDAYYIQGYGYVPAN